MQAEFDPTGPQIGCLAAGVMVEVPVAGAPAQAAARQDVTDFDARRVFVVPVELHELDRLANARDGVEDLEGLVVAEVGLEPDVFIHGVEAAAHAARLAAFAAGLATFRRCSAATAAAVS